MSTYIVVIEDDPMTAKLIEGITKVPVKWFGTAESFINNSEKLSPQCVFIDIHLGLTDNGLDLIPLIRRLWPAVPILVMTGDMADDLVRLSLEFGANDFLRKPLNAAEVNARMQARLLDCSDLNKAEQVQFEDIVINFRHHSVRCGEQETYLSAKEISLLRLLTLSFNSIVSRKLIMSEIWGKLKVTDNSIDRKVFEVRSALEQIGSRLILRSIYGKGVQLTTSEASEASAKKPHLDARLNKKQIRPHMKHLKLDQLEKIIHLGDNNSDDLLQAVSATFLESSSVVLSTLKFGIQQRDSIKIGKTAHSLKSSAAELGASQLSLLCELIERSAKNDEIDALAQLVSCLERELSSVVEELKSFLSSSRTLRETHAQ